MNRFCDSAGASSRCWWWCSRVALKRAPEKQFVQSALIGKPAPEFTLPDLLKPGGNVSSASFKGRWVLVNVWGTWCVECRAGAPGAAGHPARGQGRRGGPELQGRRR